MGICFGKIKIMNKKDDFFSNCNFTIKELFDDFSLGVIVTDRECNIV